MRWKLIGGVLIAVAAATYGYRTMTNRWETVTTTFARGDKPYGGGNFVITDRRVVSLKIAGPEITFKPAEQSKNPDVAEPTQAWMSNSGERLNRSTVNLLRGSVDGPLSRSFSERGQSAAWWHSPDANTLYISTGWMDYTLPVPPDGLSPQITTLWRSNDGGQHWTSLPWPQNQNIGRLLFVDPMRGYAIGWGPHIWRTTDGGQTWQTIELPPHAAEGKPRKTFDGVDLAKDGVLRVAYYIDRGEDVKTSSVVYRMPWGQQTFEREAVLPDQTVVDLKSAPTPTQDYALYALSRSGPPSYLSKAGDGTRRAGTISTWRPAHPDAVTALRTFDDRFTVDSLAVGKQGVLIVYATDASGSGAPRDFTLSSTDNGKSWDQSDDGMLQGGYFDPDTNTQYALEAYTLRKRGF